MESHTGGMPLCGLGAPETERVGATRSHDVEVGHTMGPPSERSHAASRNAITPRRSGLTTRNRLRYPSSAEATPELFHGTRDTTGGRGVDSVPNRRVTHRRRLVCSNCQNRGRWCPIFSATHVYRLRSPSFSLAVGLRTNCPLDFARRSPRVASPDHAGLSPVDVRRCGMDLSNMHRQCGYVPTLSNVIGPGGGWRRQPGCSASRMPP